MLRTLLFYILLFTTVFLEAQSLERTVVGSTGGTMSAGGTIMGFTVGETLVGMVSNTNTIDQGFWAGKGIVVIPLSTSESPLEIVVYPNPVVEELSIFTGENRVYGIQLFAVNAQQVMTQKVAADKIDHKIDMSHLTKGVYILQLFLEGESELLEFKIIKN